MQVTEGVQLHLLTSQRHQQKPPPLHLPLEIHHRLLPKRGGSERDLVLYLRDLGQLLRRRPPPRRDLVLRMLPPLMDLGPKRRTKIHHLPQLKQNPVYLAVALVLYLLVLGLPNLVLVQCLLLHLLDSDRP